MIKATILIVEDEAIVAADLSGKLARLGYEVCGVADRGQDAVALASSLRPDLVLMDIRLEGSMDGIEAAGAICRSHDVPVIYLTAHSDAATLERAKLTGPSGYILKPFEERELATQIELALYKHQADRQIREREEWLRVTLTSIGDAVMTTDTEGRITFLNPVASDLTGWKLEEAVGQPARSVFRIINEESRIPSEDIVGRVLREGCTVALANHTALIARDGREIPIEDSAAPIKDRDGKIIGAVLVFHDVTEKRRAREALRESEERYRELVQNANSAIIRWKSDGAITFFNEYAQVFFGYGEDEVISKHVGILVPERESTGADLTDLVQDIVKHPERYVQNINENICRDGRRVWMAWTNRPVFDANGDVAEILAVGTDITERFEAEEKIRRQKAVLEAINRIFKEALTCKTEEDLGVVCLRAAEELTQSKFGFVGEIGPDGFLHDIAMSDPGWELCTMYDKSGHRRPPGNFKLHGLYGRVLVDGKSLLANDPSSHPESIGTPVGHPPLTSFLGAPLLQNGNTIGMVALGNREGGYTEVEQQALEAIAPAIAQALLRKRAEGELAKAYEKLSRTLESITDGFLSMDRQWRYTYFNETGARMIGMKREDILGGVVWELFPHAEKTRFYTEYHRAVETNTPVHFEEFYPEPLNLWLECHCYPSEEGLSVFFRDVTERKRLEQEEERRMAGLEELVQVGSHVLASESMQELLDKVVDAARLLTGAKIGTSGHGYKEGHFRVGATSKSEDSPPCPPGSLFAVERGGVYVDLIETADSIRMNDEELSSHPLWWGLPEGHTPLRGLLGAMLTDRNGEAKGLIMVSQKEEGDFSGEDELLLKQLASIASIGLQHLEAREALMKAHDELEERVRERTSELQTYMKKLEESNQALQDFATIASHDLQEPLRKVSTFGNIIKQKCWDGLGEGGKDYLDRMLGATERMQSLLKSLLEYSRVSSRAEPLRPVELSTLIREVLSDLEVRVESCGGKVELGELPVVEADPTQMRQLFQNLIGNALKFHKEGEKPVVKIHCSANGPDCCEISVEDNGIGFEEKYLERVFAPFQRLHGKSSRYEGTGMGLAICKKIVERHGGAISARSEPGIGSVFIIRLPSTRS